MDGQVPPEVVAERYERLAALVSDVALAENEALAGSEVEVLVAEGEGRKDGATHRMSGRARDNRLVHFTPAGTQPRPGDVVTALVTRAAPHYLIADGAPVALRRTRAGDAWQARAAADTGGAAGDEGGPRLAGAEPAGAEGRVLLGIPAVGAPADRAC